jgi:hypothetical protein
MFCRSLFVLFLVLSVLWSTASDYPLVSSNFWPLYCLSFDLWLLITLLVSSNFWPLYCLSFDLWLLITLWYLQTFGHCIVCPLIYGFWLPFGIFKLLAIVLSVLWFTASDYPLVSSNFSSNDRILSTFLFIKIIKQKNNRLHWVQCDTTETTSAQVLLQSSLTLKP